MRRFLDFLFCRDFFPDVKRFTHLEVELSTVCISKCFICPRNDVWKGDLDWNVGHLEDAALFRFLQSCKHIHELVLCGAYGDPIYHPKFIEIISRLAADFPQLRVFTETNGSHRSEDWWRKLSTVTTEKHIFSFSIDGLEDTNPMYRGATKWQQIMTGVKTLRARHPGMISWKWILFRHNQHQVLEGFRLARELGFNSFKLVNSVRHNEQTTPTLDFDTLNDHLAQAQGDAQML